MLLSMDRNKLTTNFPTNVVNIWLTPTKFLQILSIYSDQNILFKSSRWAVWLKREAAERARQERGRVVGVGRVELLAEDVE